MRHDILFLLAAIVLFATGHWIAATMCSALCLLCAFGEADL